VIKIAAFDIGSNAVRMAIAHVGRDGELSVEKRVRAPLRLGSEVFSLGSLSSGTIDAAIKTFSDFKKILEHENVELYEAVATSAYRNAENSKLLGQSILEETGIFIRAIDGKEEASLIRKALQSQIDLNRKNYLLFDIGGGSAELTFLEKGELIGSTSLPMGTVRLLEIGKEANERGLSPAQAYRAYLEELSPNIIEFNEKFNPQERPIRVVGTGGNFKRLSRLRKKVLEKKNIRFVLPEEIPVIRNALEEFPYLKRVKKFGLRPDRADVIIPALYIMEHVLGHIPAKKVIAPDIGLIHGLIFELAEKALEKDSGDHQHSY
jgi:exopolyphosphatase/guanosine-5'-triphosphate,3'-diphosphate pyrophosphatase